MKHMPASGDMLLFVLGLGAACMAYFAFRWPEMFPLILMGLGTLLVVFVVACVAWLVTRASEHAEIETSGDINTFTWALANRVGMDAAQKLRAVVAYEKEPGCNHGVMAWKPGYNLKRYQNLAARTFGVNVEIQTADEVIKGRK